MKRKYLKVAVTPEVYSMLARAADQRGLTLATFVRTELERRQAPISFAALEARFDRIEALLPIARWNEGSAHERLLTEVLLLLRELACERNAQVLARVRQQIVARFGRDEP